MRPLAVLSCAGLIGLCAGLPVAAQQARGVAPKGPLNTLADVQNAIIGCWKWPPASEISRGMDLTIRVSFKRSGELFGARLTYQTRDVSPEERALYHGALLDMLKRCSPLPLSESLGQAVAGRQFTFYFHDTRGQRSI
jgi:hypothetical protein